MTREKLKVLEMVADGKISPEEGVRLIEALGGAGRSHGRGMRVMPIDVADIQLPKIDLGRLGEVCVEVKKSVSEGARKAHKHIKRSRAGRFLDLKDYPISMDRSPTMETCRVHFDVSAGMLKVKGQDIGEKVFVGKVKRTPDEPVVITEERDGTADMTLRHSLGRCLLRLTPELPMEIKLDNSAADSRLQLERVRVHGLDIDNNAGSVVVVLGELVDQINMSISNNAGSVLLKLPASHAVRIKSSSSMSTDNLEKLGLEAVDGIAASNDWAENPKKVDIVLGQNVASFKLDWKRHDGVAVSPEEDKEVYNFEDLDDDQDTE